MIKHRLVFCSIRKTSISILSSIWLIHNVMPKYNLNLWKVSLLIVSDLQKVVKKQHQCVCISLQQLYHTYPRYNSLEQKQLLFSIIKGGTSLTFNEGYKIYALHKTCVLCFLYILNDSFYHLCKYILVSAYIFDIELFWLINFWI